MLANTMQQSMKEKTIVVKLQSKTACSSILHYHLQQNTVKLNYKMKWNLHKNSQGVKKGVAHAKNDSMKKF